MKQRNDWLGFLNQLPLPSPLISILNTFVGVKENSTLRYINVERQNQFDRFLGKWEDGKPVGEKYAGGDDAVLNFSASLDNAAHVINLLGFDHGDLVETIAGQQAIMNILGLSPSGIVAAPEITYEPSLVFQLASSVNMTILGPDGWQIGQGVENNIPNSTYSPENKFILIPNPLEGNYEIHVTSEEDGGSYQLIVGLITEGGDYWRVYQGVATPSSPGDHIFFSPTPNRLKSYLLTQSKATIFSLKKNFNKQKITPQLRGKIESKLAVCLGNINAALDLLEDSNNSSANQKIEKALLAILDLEEFLETNPDSLKDLFSNPLKGVKDLLFQAYEF
ncbi:hypothetical protein COU95_00855 [Candidatus Shapirobacteria bacterium CG10_big_fil_rev_8_21_14_0_10_40_9]|uniref:Uncharacterized protein n=1 Tax=Candidatus Shapirobacteria bacterium CG10_big_fil_rev_8_21_14_0_10_40_9 TaxID=1974888 RepID=A0A2M8L4C2_9BACT|nr:MAG: hypothetical protein COU95_00855 [Candidatus Shapirobacteria bacterium CG10_big_fil_rev_8_21_14_0_10_40_9]